MYKKEIQETSKDIKSDLLVIHRYNQPGSIEEEDGGSGEGEVVFEGFSVEMEELEEDEESNQFSSIKSTLSWKQLIHIDGNYTIACRF